MARPSPCPQPQRRSRPPTRRRRSARATSCSRETPRVRIDTPSLAGSINLKGARFDDLVLVRQRETIAKDSPPVRLLSPAGATGAYFASFGWTGQGVAAPDANSVWTASAPILTPGKPVTLSWTNPTGQRFELIVSVDDGYLFTVKQRVVNMRRRRRSRSRPTAWSAAPTKSRRPVELDQPCRPDRLPRRQGRL